MLPAPPRQSRPTRGVSPGGPKGGSRGGGKGRAPSARPPRVPKTSPKRTQAAVRRAQRELAAQCITDGVVLALDTSSVCVGYAVFHVSDGVRALVTHGRLRLKGKDHGDRLAYFREQMITLLLDYAVTHVVYEEPYPGRNRNAYPVLMMYVGLLRAVHAQRFGADVPPSQRVPARMVKRVLGTPKGLSHEENKRVVLLEVNRLYGLSLKFKANDKSKLVSQDDEADAIALGHAWLAAAELAPEVDAADPDALDA